MNKRDICRFRAWLEAYDAEKSTKDNVVLKKQMFYNVESPNTTDLTQKSIGCPIPFDEIFLYNNPVIMQSSGIRDITGKLIYEGDVIEIEQGKSIRTFLVTYYYDNTYGLGFKLHEIDKEDNSLDHWSYCFVTNSGEKITVIGNVYENEEYTDIQEIIKEYIEEYQEDWLFPIRKNIEKQYGGKDEPKSE